MTKIITDSTACLPTEIAKRYSIPIIPQIINFGSESFYEGVDITIDEFLTRLRSSNELPKTAAPPPELFAREFQRLTGLAEPIICIHPSAEVSGTVRSAIVASRDFPNLDIRVIDTRTLASPLGKMVQFAAEWAQAGVEVDTIVTRVENLSQRCRIYFLVDTLEYLARGGRIGGAAALLGGMLQIKPILRLNDGRVDQYERERTYKRAYVRLKEIVLEQASKDHDAYMSVLYAGNEAAGQTLADELGRKISQPKVPLVSMPPAIITHGGPGILGVGFFVKESREQNNQPVS